MKLAMINSGTFAKKCDENITAKSPITCGGGNGTVSILSSSKIITVIKDLLSQSSG